MARSKNRALATWMAANKVEVPDLTELVNTTTRQITGRVGTTSERTVFRWLSGENRWPREPQRLALAAITGRSPTDLGFVPNRRAPSQEEPVKRRTFVTAATGTVLAVGAPTAAARPTVGFTEVKELRDELTALWLTDDTTGGGTELENRAKGLAARTLGLQRNGSATQRVRGHLYSLAASFTAAAMWAAVDARHFDDAQRHLEEAITLAGLSGNAQVQHQAWRYAAMLASQRGRYTDSVAAAEAATNTRVHRADPLYASLSHSRLALSAADAGDRPRALRALDRAAASFAHADPGANRPASMDFYTEGELHGLAGATLLRLDNGERAEFHTHRALAALRPDQHRNRAYYTAQAALTQLRQGDIEQAVATAHHVIPPAGAATGRVPHLLGKFTSALTMRAPDTAVTREWIEHTQTVRPRPRGATP
ncbi:Tat pathway signal protein [Streptomyces sp. NBC_01431]|uniref:Tat pathway signal protein n=1 Tax=Streptomyces sp. NBC_01431 TaxID=2903863 RepID=UPI002E302F94|nr:Tat pathway signal protein [Streptomyces sp. NBC_01431]